MLRGFCNFYNEGPKENPLYPHPQWPKPPALPVLGSPVLLAPRRVCRAHTGRGRPARSPRLPAARCRVTDSGQGSRLDRENQGLMHKPKKTSSRWAFWWDAGFDPATWGTSDSSQIKACKYLIIHISNPKNALCNFHRPLALIIMRLYFNMANRYAGVTGHVEGIQEHQKRFPWTHVNTRPPKICLHLSVLGH